jgi:hypothetical protein
MHRVSKSKSCKVSKVVLPVVLGAVLFVTSAGIVIEDVRAEASEAARAKPKGKKAKKKADKKGLKITGGLQFGLSNDRNAGNAPLGETNFADSFDDDEDGENEGGFSDFDTNIFEVLDLDDQDVLDQIDETNDEDGDGDFFDDDEDFQEGDIVEVDLDGDGIDDDFDGDGVDDDLDSEGDNGDDSDGGDDGSDEPQDDDSSDDPSTDDGATDEEPIAEEFSSERAGSRRGSSGKRIISDDRLTARAKLGLSYKFKQFIKEWKLASQVATAHFDTLNKNNNLVVGVNTGPVFEVKQLKAKIQPSFAYANLHKDGENQFDNYAGILDAQFDLTKTWVWDLKYAYDLRNFDNADVDNIRAHSPSTAVAYKFNKKQSVSLAARMRFEDTLVLARAKDQYQSVLGYKHKLDSGWYFAPQLGYAFIERGAAVNAKQKRREDNRITYNVVVGKDIAKDFNIEAQYGQMDSDSNINDKDTSNDRFALLAGWKF